MPHNSQIRDTDRFFIINPQSRAVTPEIDETDMLMQYDHNSERFTFKCPQFIDGHDMSECDRIEIHFTNTSSSKDGTSANVYYVDDQEVTEDGYMLFTWLIGNTATTYAGTLSFVVRFVCLDDENKIIYAWHTAICSGKWVGAGMNNNASIEEEYIATKEIFENGTYEIGEYDRLIVKVPIAPETALTSIDITENGQYKAPSNQAYTQINVSVIPPLQEKTITANGEFTPNVGYDGFAKVVVNVPGELVDEYDGTVVVTEVS